MHFIDALWINVECLGWMILLQAQQKFALIKGMLRWGQENKALDCSQDAILEMDRRDHAHCNFGGWRTNHQVAVLNFWREAVAANPQAACQRINTGRSFDGR